MGHLGVLSVFAAACLLGVVMSQTTLSPAVTITTVSVNVTTPSIPGTTEPSCSVLNTSTCAACAPGTYYDNDAGLCVFPAACLPCTQGFYQPLAGQLGCLSCPSGFFSNFTGSPVCRACSPGSYNNNTASISCSACTPGFYTSLPNSTSCNPCPQGTYCNSSSCAQCQICPAGSEALQVAASQCTPCRPGMHKVSHQTICKICNRGFYQIHWGQENCDLCPENNYCPSPDVNPIQCPNDAFCPEGSTAPGYCMETFFRKAGETCELAPVTIALLVIGGGVGLLFIIVLVLRRKKDNDSELSLGRTPLLRKDRPPGRFYGIPCDAEPVYAGW
ncbi:sushi, von Willebrand factor type A, EGF and pentraxin domain-containing protein 1 isoform X2 [Triplophysa dalaica]|uniref:sushi, von Willebrand factor type A, EGF and pentraxin domain-containing protein 1 isoform X2 n=1 Tax=Triplophysa dalaica TaxID=1582913 RepID=UPI0024DF6ABC|nr:sushi, von Willebrand factor type A, EGF and pentraxin domain-containing protein 1 isoform X2 [Triplophysa dalaica]